jgi:hypothetical protein
MVKKNGGLVEVDVEVWANRRLESSTVIFLYAELL